MSGDLSPTVTLLGCMLSGMSHLAIGYHGLSPVLTPIAPLMFGFLLIGFRFPFSYPWQFISSTL